MATAAGLSASAHGQSVAIRVEPPQRANGPIVVGADMALGVGRITATADYDRDGFDNDDPSDSRGGGALPSATVELFGTYFLWEYGQITPVRVDVVGTDGTVRSAVFDVGISAAKSAPASGVRGGRGVVTARAVARLRLGIATEGAVVAFAGTPTRSTTARDANFYHDDFHVLGYGPCGRADPYSCRSVFELRFIDFGQPNEERLVLDGFSTGVSAYRTARGSRRGDHVMTMRRRERGEQRDGCTGDYVLGRRLRIGVGQGRVTGLSVASDHSSLFFGC